MDLLKKKKNLIKGPEKGTQSAKLVNFVQGIDIKAFECKWKQSQLLWLEKSMHLIFYFQWLASSKVQFRDLLLIFLSNE